MKVIYKLGFRSINRNVTGPEDEYELKVNSSCERSAPTSPCVADPLRFLPLGYAVLSSNAFLINATNCSFSKGF